MKMRRPPQSPQSLKKNRRKPKHTIKSSKINNMTLKSN